MARRSVDRRLDRLLDALLPPGSFERRKHDLSDELRAALQLYEEESTAIFFRVRKSDPTPGAAYGRLLDGDLIMPTMPPELRDALGLVDPPEVTEAMTLEEVAAIWQNMLEGDHR